MKKREAVLPRRVEGLPEACWVRWTYLDVVVHVFMPTHAVVHGLESLLGEVLSRRVDA